MPLIVFDCKGITATRRERIQAAVEAGGRHVKEQYEGWIAADPFRGGVRVVITGPHGFERAVLFDFGTPQWIGYFTTFTQQNVPTDSVGDPAAGSHPIGDQDPGSMAGH